MMDKKRLPPQAFRGPTENKILGAIRVMATKMFLHARKPFEIVDLMHLFLDPMYHGPMQIAFSENRGGDLSHSLYVSLQRVAPHEVETSGNIEFQWVYHEIPNGFFPRYLYGGSPNHPITKIEPSCPFDTAAKFRNIAEQLCRISYEWGLIYKVFTELNQPNFCTTPAQMRFVWPPILPILKWTDSEGDLVRMLQHTSSRAGDRARVPLSVQPVLRESYQIMTRALLILENPVEDVMGMVRYNVTQPRFKRHGLEFEGSTA